MLILADHYSGLAHKLLCSHFLKCHLCGNICKQDINTDQTGHAEDECKRRTGRAKTVPGTESSLFAKYRKKNINIEMGVGVYMNISMKGNCL